MRNFNKPKIMMVTLLTCVTFGAHAAWWDIWQSAGDDGNINTKGNSAAEVSKSSQTAGKLKLSVAVVNNTKSILASAVLKDKTGKVLYTSTKGRTCAAGAVCWLHVTRSSVTKGNTFFFYDSKNNLVSAHMAGNIPATAPLYNIGASMDDLGMYVLSKISAVNPKITEKTVDDDIVTTTLKATPNQELADYYLDLMGNSKDNTAQEAKVIKTLADQFAKNKDIPANPDSARLIESKPANSKM